VYPWSCSLTKGKIVRFWQALILALIAIAVIVWFGTHPNGTAAIVIFVALGAVFVGVRFASFRRIHRARAARNPLGPRFRCGRCGKPISPAWVGECKHCDATFDAFPPVAAPDLTS
jgi:hypothetical protein